MAYTAKPAAHHPGWYEIPGIKNYLANTKGEILSLRTRVISMGSNTGHYKRIHIFTVGYVYVHKLVCLAFYGLPQAGRNYVNHKDGNKLNNAASNLEWVTPSENIFHSWKMRKNVSIEEFLLLDEMPATRTTGFWADY